VPVAGSLEEETDTQDGGHLHVVGNVELRGRGRQHGGQVDGQDLTRGQVHRATPVDIQNL